MDCYIKSIYNLLEIKNREEIDIDKFSVLSNYNISEFLVLTKAAKAFDIPVIVPSRTKESFNSFQKLFQLLVVKGFNCIDEYLDFLYKNLERVDVVVRIDRFFLYYILPKAKMNAHFVHL